MATVPNARDLQLSPADESPERLPQDSRAKLVPEDPQVPLVASVEL